MASAGTASVPALIRGVLDDARELIRDEIALARLEVREEVVAAKRAGVALGAGATLGIAGVTMLCVALAAGAADLFDAPLWLTLAVGAVVLAVAGYFLISTGRTQLAAIEILPKTQQSIRDTVTWIQSKSKRG